MDPPYADPTVAGGSVVVIERGTLDGLFGGNAGGILGGTFGGVAGGIVGGAAGETDLLAGTEMPEQAASTRKADSASIRAKHRKMV